MKAALPNKALLSDAFGSLIAVVLLLPLMAWGQYPRFPGGWCEYAAREGERFPPARLNLPEWACYAAFNSNLHDRYALYARINPFFLTGDFNGDGKSDIAIWVTDRRSKKRGILILHRDVKDPIVLGAGKTFGGLHDGFDDLVSLDMWSIVPKGKVLPATHEDKAVTLQGDALEVGKADSHGFTIYWDGSSYRTHGD